MNITTSLLLAPLALAGLIVPAVAATGPAGGPIPTPAASTARCMAPAELLTTLATAGDWVIGKSPKNVDGANIKGVVFRESGMIDVALFEGGCLAAVVVVGKAAPDIIA